MQKTNKSAAKRFKITASGKVKFGSAGKRHCLSHRSRRKKLRLKHGSYATPGDAKHVQRCLPYGGLL